ncbi:hypothetical protein B0H15DRAFT_958763 [Mycena belliarum]|uniref:Uncharacterized protein n=1 Tax=Mycena belliarum TaxID=1033014 RepID=A0AAD6TK08_9AGAR|nr:hypothetical protein B0H15DRAFT_958763 [Mycena belliae]
MLGRRTLRSGKEFSAFDLALTRAVSPAIHFDIRQQLQATLLQEYNRTDENEAVYTPPPRAPTPVPTPVTAIPEAAPMTARERNQQKSHARRKRRREEEQAGSDNPRLKRVHRTRIAEGKKAVLGLDVDTAAFVHSKSAWIGARDTTPAPGDTTPASGSSSVPPAAPQLDAGLGGIEYTQAEVDELVGTPGFRYIPWLGRVTIPLLDSQRRIIGVLGGMPRDHEDWQKVTNGAAALLEERIPRIRLSKERLHHRRAEEPFPAVARGISFGGRQTEPGELCNNVANTELTDELLAHEHFVRIAGFANMLFMLWAPLLFAFYQAQMALLAVWKPSMRWNFVGSVFAACTFNFGRAVTTFHVDFANLAWGWCAITALGAFDADYGGHLILWDLRLIVRFPAGSTILIPSALVHHSNTPIGPFERRSSFTQYTAGGLFRWIRNSFKTDKEFTRSASREERARRTAEDSSRWQEGVQMLAKIDDL